METAFNARPPFAKKSAALREAEVKGLVGKIVETFLTQEIFLLDKQNTVSREPRWWFQIFLELSPLAAYIGCNFDLTDIFSNRLVQPPTIDI